MNGSAAVRRSPVSPGDVWRTLLHRRVPGDLFDQSGSQRVVSRTDLAVAQLSGALHRSRIVRCTGARLTASLHRPRALRVAPRPPPADNTVSTTASQPASAPCVTRSAAPPDIRMIPPLGLAAQRYVCDLVSHPELDGQIGSDGSTPQSRSAAAGYRRSARPSRSMRHWPSTPRRHHHGWYRPAAWAIMSDCANTAIGVHGFGNSLDRSVVVAVIQPA